MHGPPHISKGAIMTFAVAHPDTAALVLPSALLLALLGIVSLQTGVLKLPVVAERGFAPITVTIQSRDYAFRATGEFVQGTASVDGPLIQVSDPAPLDVMKFQVTAEEYARCVADGACKKAEPRRVGSVGVPVTGVSFDDATDYSEWLSAKTGQTWRLPTVAEWTFAAGSKARDHALDVKTDAGDPAQRWLAYYEREAKLGAGVLATPSPTGSFGENEYGVADLSETVWEWTVTCGGRTTLGASGETLKHLDSCGVRLLEGRHRTPMSAFVKDAQGGGCTIGAPPDNLGFRLVREREWWRSPIDYLLGLVTPSPTSE